MIFEGHYFDIASNGRFTMVNKEGEDVREVLKTLFEKLISHLLWIGLWVTLFSFISLLLLQKGILLMILFHLFIFSFRLTQFFLEGGIKSLFFPPLWEKISRRLEKGEGIELLKKYKLENHSGLLYNLSLYENTT